MTEKLAIVFSGSAQLVSELAAERPPAERYEVAVAARYPESDRYPGRPGVTGVLLVTRERIDDNFAGTALAHCARAASVVAAYRLEERMQWDYERTWSGHRTPGMKQLSFLVRADGMSRDAFAGHWHDVHAPLARKHHPTIWRYVQDVVLERLTDDSPEIDGLAELSYRSYEDWRDRKYDSDEGQAVIVADIPRFIDTAASWHVLGHEHVYEEG
jgi:uncharacterized protein (TIGR02118 family)